MDDYSDLFADHVDGPIYTDLRSLEVRPVRWLDKPFLPWAELTLLAGEGDVGKGLFSCYQAAKVSRQGGMVVFSVAEDAFETTLKPRLLAAEADLNYVRCLSWQRRGTSDTLRIPEDIPALERSLHDLNAALLVIDPLMSHLESSVDSYVDHKVKLALLPLVSLAQRTGALVLGIHHLNKDRSRGVRGSVMGSSAFVNTPRAVLAMARDDFDPDARIVEVVKSNLGPKGEGRTFRIETTLVPGLVDPQPMMVNGSNGHKPIDGLWLGRVFPETNPWDG